jgi:SAM-dependent methyltransferase
MQPVSCPACDRKDAALHLEQEVSGLGNLRLVRCLGCGLGYLDPQPGPAEIAPFYAHDYYGGKAAKFEPSVERMRGLLARRRARRLAAGLPPRARVLDVGCGDGRLLAAFSALGHDGVGTERGSDHPRAGAAGGCLEIREGDLTDGSLAAASFDLCIYWHVLEHLHDPRASLLEAWRLLKPGGRLVVAVPNLESLQARWAGPAWFHLDLPRHLFHFAPGSLAALLARAGFGVQRIGHHAVEQNPFGIVQSALNLKARPGAPLNVLYEELKGNQGPGSPGASVARRGAYVLGMPIALVLATLESLAGRGGTIEAWAVRKESR